MFAIEASPSATRNITVQRVPAERDIWRTGLAQAGRRIGRQAILERVGYDLELAMKARQNRRSG